MGERLPETQKTSWNSREIIKKTVRVISAMAIVAGAVGLIASCAEQKPKFQEVNSSEFHTATPKENWSAFAMALSMLIFVGNEQNWGGDPKDKPSS
ncbi:MAG: hypothetical protein Q7R31_02270 [Candidatus Levybacteria bacterium]|nr:hypothetical protein [Candidatus Levybacteria bacterium]